MNLSENDPLKSVCETLVRAFPQGVPEPLYLPLLIVLTEEMSFRAISTALSVAFGMDSTRVLHDAYGAASMADRESSAIAEVHSKLHEAGYDKLSD